MKPNRFKKKLILPVFVLLPILIYGVFELNSLTKDEEALEQIYERQLDAILFSIEQYVDDKLRKWTTEMDDSYALATDAERLEALSINNPVFRAIYLKGYNEEEPRLLSAKDDYNTAEFLARADSIYQNSSDLFSRLRRYKESNFVKLEVMEQSLRMGRAEIGVLPFVLGTKSCAVYGVQLDWVDGTPNKPLAFANG